MGTRHALRLLGALFAATLLSLAACNGSGSSGDGALNLSISDTPVDGAQSVVISFTGVEIQPAGTEDDGSADKGTDDSDGMDSEDGSGSQRMEFDFATPKQIDLLQQQGTNSAALLSGVSLPAGHYAWIRLKVDASHSSITLLDGSVHPLVIPSGAETGLKLVHGFSVAQGGVVDFTIDFNLRRSITEANGQYILKPVLQVMNDLDVGMLEGSVSNTFTIGSVAVSDPACLPAVYVYSGAGVTPVDINPTSTVQPVASAALKLDNDTGAYMYSVGFLAPGDYTVTLACGADDDPSVTDNLTFATPKDVTVSADTTAVADFP